MINIGIPIWLGNISEDLVCGLNSLLAYGVNMVELSIDYPWPFKESCKLQKLIALVKQNNMHINLHAPWRDIILASPYGEIGRASIEVILRSVNDLINEVSSYIVVHPLTMQRLDISDNRKEALSKFRENIKELTRRLDLDNHSVMIVVENLVGGIGAEPGDLAETIEGLDHVGLCLDIGHLASRYKRYLSEYYEDFYTYLKDVVESIGGIKVHVIHIHDVDEHGREHLLIGEGFLDFKQIFKIISKLGPKNIVFEVFRSKNLRVNLNTIAKNIGDAISWAKIYMA